MRLNKWIWVAQDVVFLRGRSQVIHNFGNLLGIAFGLFAPNSGDTIVDVQITYDPIIILKFFDVVQSCSEEKANPTPTLDVLFCIHVAAVALIGRFEYVVPNLKVTTELLTLGVLRFERETGFKF